MNTEQLLISKILVDRDLTQALDANIRTEFFGSEGSRDAWDWILLYRSEYAEVPTSEAFLRKFPNFALDLSPNEPTKALIDELFANYKIRLTNQGLVEAGQVFAETNDVDLTLPIIQEFVSTIHADLSRSDVQLASEIVGDLVVKYINAEENAMPGVPTGFQLIDEALGGLQDEQLITIIGLPKAMKSSYLLWMASTAAMHGYRAGLLSFEMSNAEQEARWLSLNAHVNLTRMQRGQLTETEQNRLHAFEAVVTETEGLGELVFVHDVAGASTVSGIQSKQEQHGFDVLFVDGVYLMEDEHGEPRGSSQALTNITRGLKRLGQVAKIPIVCTTQALFSRTSKARGIEMESIGYTSSFAQDSDVLIGIDRNDTDNPVAKLKVIAARNALGLECEVSIDYTTGYVEDRGLVTSDAGSTDPIGYGGDDDT